MTYQEFVEKANQKGWSLLQDYTNNIKPIQFAIRLEIWGTPDSKDMYFVEVLSNNIIVVYKYVDDFQF